MLCAMVFWTVFSFCNGPAHAIGSSKGSQALSLTLLKDPERRLSFDDILIEAEAGSFEFVGSDGFSDGYGKTGAYWLRFTLPAANAAEEVTHYLEFRPKVADDLEIYLGTSQTAQSAADFEHLSTGSNRPYADRPVRDPRLLVPVTLKSWPQAVYVRMQSRFATALNVTLSSENDMLASGLHRALLSGGFISVCFFVILINLNFWYWLRDLYYLLYAGYAAAMVFGEIWQANLTFLLVPDVAHLVRLPVFGLSSLLFLSAGLWFAIDFLKIRQASKLSYYMMLAMVAVGPVHLCMSFLNLWHLTYLPLTVLTQILFLYPFGFIVYLALWKKDSRARIYLLSFVPITIALALIMARGLGWIGSSQLLLDSTKIGAMVHLIIMTIGLGYRIRRSENERFEAEHKALQVARSANERANQLVEQRTRELTSANGRLEAALNSERQLARQQLQFIDMISHEYKTPLSVLQTNLDLLEMSVKKGVQLSEKVLNRMHVSVDRLKEIIEVGLHSDRVAMRSFSVKKEDFRLDDLVTDAIHVVASMYPRRRIDYVARQQLKTLIFHGDLAMLKTALVNLLDNGLKYTDADQAVRIHLDRTGGEIDCIILSVSDEGSGIAERDQPYVFDKYFRASDKGGTGGAGLGLYLVKKIVEAHDGTVSLQSSQAGTVVTIEIKLQSDHRKQSQEKMNS